MMGPNIESFRRVLGIVRRSASMPVERRPFRFTIWMQVDYDLHQTVRDIVEHPCGTAGCIGGWGCVLRMLDTDPDRHLLDDDCDPLFDGQLAQEFYGITWKEAEYLFYGEWHPMGIDAHIGDIIKKLQNIIETGKVVNEEFDLTLA